MSLQSDNCFRLQQHDYYGISWIFWSEQHNYKICLKFYYTTCYLKDILVLEFFSVTWTVTSSKWILCIYTYILYKSKSCLHFTQLMCTFNKYFKNWMLLTVSSFLYMVQQMNYTWFKLSVLLNMVTIAIITSLLQVEKKRHNYKYVSEMSARIGFHIKVSELSTPFLVLKKKYKLKEMFILKRIAMQVCT